MNEFLKQIIAFNKTCLLILLANILIIILFGHDLAIYNIHGQNNIVWSIIYFVLSFCILYSWVFVWCGNIKKPYAILRFIGPFTIAISNVIYSLYPQDLLLTETKTKYIRIMLSVSWIIYLILFIISSIPLIISMMEMIHLIPNIKPYQIKLFKITKYLLSNFKIVFVIKCTIELCLLYQKLFFMLLYMIPYLVGFLLFAAVYMEKSFMGVRFFERHAHFEIMKKRIAKAGKKQSAKEIESKDKNKLQ